VSVRLSHAEGPAERQGPSLSHMWGILYLACGGAKFVDTIEEIIDIERISRPGAQISNFRDPGNLELVDLVAVLRRTKAGRRQTGELPADLGYDTSPCSFTDRRAISCSRSDGYGCTPGGAPCAPPSNSQLIPRSITAV
jgi:hypothetical protein